MKFRPRLPVALVHRRRRRSDVWHFCPQCSQWPAKEYVEKSYRPSSGELCDQCRSKAKRGLCSPAS